MNNKLETLVNYFCQRGPVILLESQSDSHPWSRHTYLAALPKTQIEAYNDKITVSFNGTRNQKKQNPWEALQLFRKQQDDWLFGYLGYDLKNHIEKLHSQNYDPIDAPDLYFMVPQFLLAFDHSTSTYKILKGDLPEQQYLDATDKSGFNIKLQGLRCQTSQHQYKNKILEAQRRIKEGEFYEVNLSHQLLSKYNGSPFKLYRQMKKVGPVPFGAFFKKGDISITCQSPERFLRKEGTRVFSQPIKGTAERSEDMSQDEMLKKHLAASSKERAENLMIVDLVRNDLNQIAYNGSVRVPNLFNIESFGTVHQMVSTIEAEARETDPISILKACFPMGSMTGAPKISVMETIEELETYKRGIYSGAIGYITPGADFDFNVIIRTAILKRNQLFYSTGGAITSDSDPHKEWQETMIKAKALTDVLSH